MADGAFFIRRTTAVLTTLAVFFSRMLFSAIRARFSRRARKQARKANAKHLRHALESLGGTFVKFGQVLATRPDYLPDEYIRELEFLLDQVSPFPTAVAVQVVEEELKTDPMEVFSVFPGKLVAAASFGQVYDAQLRGGIRVAVKVQRPAMDKIVRADLRLLKALTGFIDATTLIMSVKLRTIFSDFEAWTWQELDYRLEARFANRLRRNAADSPIEAIPAVHWELTSRRLLVLEYLEGLWVKDILTAVDQKNDVLLAQWEKDGLDLGLIARNLLRVLLREGFTEGLFHADPHPSNIVILEGNRIGLVDFGIVGYVGHELRTNLQRLLHELSAGRPSGAFRELLRIAPPPGNANLKAFRAEYQAHVDSWQSAVGDPFASLAEKSAARLLFGNLNSMRKYGLHLPGVLIRYYRALIIVDGIILRLDPEIDTATELHQFLDQLVTQHILETLTEDDYYRAILGYQSIFMQLPAVLSELLETRMLINVLESGERLGAGFVDIGRNLDKAKERTLRILSTAALVAAVVVLVLRIGGNEEYRLFDHRSAPWSVVGVVLLLSYVLFGWLARRVRARA
jgi:ubiquinone biosynthesis protein